MSQCRKCQAVIPVRVMIDGKIRNFQHRKFCLICSPFNQHNTRDITKPKPKPTRGTPESVRRFRINKKQKMIDYKGGKCQICGYNRCNRCLHFHHTDPTTKVFEISRCPSWGFDRIKPELDKCILLCSNCHGEVHAGVIDLKLYAPKTES